MPDSFSEVTYQSWGSRIKESSQGALIAFGSLPLSEHLDYLYIDCTIGNVGCKPNP